MKSLAIVIPAHNEEGNISPLADSIFTHVKEFQDLKIDLYFIDDGSSDNTFLEIEKLSQKNSQCHGIKLSGNFGHQNALRAGLDHIDADAVIMMDADLQHPPKILSSLILKWREGYQVVNTIREYQLSTFKQISSYTFYKLLNFISPIKLRPGVADFRLLDRGAILSLKKFNEAQIFYRGIVPMLGFKQAYIPYQADKRVNGSTKYTLIQMIQFAMSGITSLSTLPLYVAITLGLITFCLSLIYAFYVLAVKFYWGDAISGWSSLIIAILFIGSVQMILLGIIGIYISKIFWEVKNRPPYIIEKVI